MLPEIGGRFFSEKGLWTQAAHYRKELPLLPRHVWLLLKSLSLHYEEGTAFLTSLTFQTFIPAAFIMQWNCNNKLIRCLWIIHLATDIQKPLGSYRHKLSALLQHWDWVIVGGIWARTASKRTPLKPCICLGQQVWINSQVLFLKTCLGICATTTVTLSQSTGKIYIRKKFNCCSEIYRAFKNNNKE